MNRQQQIASSSHFHGEASVVKNDRLCSDTVQALVRTEYAFEVVSFACWKILLLLQNVEFDEITKLDCSIGTNTKM